MEIDGRSLRQMIIPPEQLTVPLSITFEQATDALLALPRMFVEPDGSFVWAIDSAELGRGQLDGSLLDRGDTLQYVELKGNCSLAALDRLLAIFRPQDKSLVIQLLQQAALLDEGEFRRVQFSDP